MKGRRTRESRSPISWIEWYDSLAMPSRTPAPSTISLTRMALYPIIVTSFGFAFVQTFRRKMPPKVALPFAVNLVPDLLFMPTFAGLRSVPLAAADTVIAWTTPVRCVGAVWPHSRWVAVAQGPYFAWVSIATVLRLTR